MRRENYIPKSDESYLVFESTFLSKIAGYTAALGLLPADVAAVTAAINAHRGSYQDAADAKATASAAVHTAQNDRATSEMLLRRLVQVIKNSSAYTDVIGTDLGIIGAEQVVDYNNVKPKVAQVLVHPDMVIIDWIKGPHQGVAIYADVRTAQNSELNPGEVTPQMAAQIQWEEIGRDMRSPFEDRRSNISANPEFRYYKLRYLRNDQPIGLDSDIIKVLTDIPI